MGIGRIHDRTQRRKESVFLAGYLTEDITLLFRGACKRVLNLQMAEEGSSGNVATAANRTREIRLSGMRGGLAETWLWMRLNGHVKRKRRNSQAET